MTGNRIPSSVRSADSFSPWEKRAPVLSLREAPITKKGPLSRPFHSGDLDRHVRQLLDLAEKHIALHHRADVFRRAGIDDVAWHQLEGFRELRDLLGDAPDHVREI